MSTNVCFLSQLYAILRRIPTQNFTQQLSMCQEASRGLSSISRQNWSPNCVVRKLARKVPCPPLRHWLKGNSCYPVFSRFVGFFLRPPDRQSVELVEEVVLLVVILETDVTDIISTPTKSGGDFWQQCCQHRSLQRVCSCTTHVGF